MASAHTIARGLGAPAPRAPASLRPRPSASLANPGAPPPVASTSNRCVPAYRAGARRRPFRPTRLAAAANDTDDSLSHYYSEAAAGPPDLDELMALYRARRGDVGPSYSADDAARELEHPSAPRGRVYLVGTGPGDPGLLTLKAYHLMQTADVVMYDRLVAPAILDLVSPDAHMLYVGKQSGFHTRTQDEIEQMLLGFAGRGATVVRLKGGDPLVFGRGGEEMETLMARGHEVRIVPGVTAAAGVGSELGIPLTHRGAATSVRLLTGHLREGAAKEAALGLANEVTDPVDFAVTSADRDTTLVVYMGLATLPALAAKLVESGFPSDMPAVAVERGTTPKERRVFSDIENLPAAVQDVGLKSPTLIIVGNTVRLSPWWPWRDEEGAAVARGPGKAHGKAAYVAQEGLPAENTAAWFHKNAETIRKLNQGAETEGGAEKPKVPGGAR